MEIYDTANRLAEEIRNSQQFKMLKKSKEELFNNPEKKKLIEEFEELKREVQIMEVKRESNQEIDEEDKKVKLAKLYNVLIENKDINHEIINISNKIIGDSFKEIL